MNVVPLFASGMSLGMGLAIAAVAIGLALRITSLVHGAKRIFPRH